MLGAAVLRNIGQGLRSDEIGRSFRRGWESLTGCELADEDGRHWPDTRNGLDCRHEAAVEQDGRRDPTNEVANLGQRLTRLLLPFDDQLLCRCRIRVDPLARETEVDRQHDEALLGTVVEVALDPVEFARFDVEDGRAALPKRLDLAPQLAAFRRAQEAGDDAAVESHDELRQGRCRREQRGACDHSNEHDSRVVARQRPEKPRQRRTACRVVPDRRCQH